MQTQHKPTPASPGAGLTAGQRALLEAELTRRRHALESRLALHHGGNTRAEHAHEVLQQDGDDAPQRDAERSVDLALTELETQELGAVHQALRRIHEADFGLCGGCGDAIPFDRLKVEPQALHCVACPTQREGPLHTPARL